MTCFWKMLLRSIGLTVFAGLSLVGFLAWSKDYVSQSSEEYIINNVIDLEEKPADAVIILGAKVYNSGKLSPVLKDRADLALQIYREKKAKKLLISGDNGSKTHNEITPIYQYLKKFKIPDSDIFVDFAGFDTQDSMYRAKHNFGVTSIIIPTQSRFINRSVFLALKYGMQPQGIVTLYDYQPVLLFGWHTREDFATIKAVLETRRAAKSQIASDDLYPIAETGNSVLYFSAR